MAYKQRRDEFFEFNPQVDGFSRRLESTFSTSAIVLFAVLCTCLIFRYFKSRTRHSVVVNFAKKYGLKYLKLQKIDSIFSIDDLSVFSLFKKKNLYARNLIMGKMANHSVLFFDFYEYQAKHSKHIHPFVCAIFKLAYDPLPDFILRPSSDIKFSIPRRNTLVYESPNKAFNKIFHLEYEGDDMINFRPTREFIECMLRQGIELTVEKKDKHMLIYSKSKKHCTTDYNNFIHHCLSIYDMYP